MGSKRFTFGSGSGLATGALLAFLAASPGGCKRQESPAAQPTLASDPALPQPTPSKPSLLSRLRDRPAPTPALPPPPTEIWKEFSGTKAFAEVQKQVEIGPRVAGSPEVEQARTLITQALTRSGWEVQRQPFTDETPRGPVNFVNLIARFPSPGTKTAGKNTQQAIVCSHYDTKRFSTIRFVGASDGASSTGALVELARVLALDPQLASKVELVFFDGEEAFAQFTESDGLYGSRFYARSLRESARNSQFKFGILWDMIGDKNLSITLPSDSPQPLTQGILSAADSLGLRGYFAYFDRSIFDDHVPLNLARIPTVDLIDFDYMPWHTADDTLDKLSPESLQKVGSVTLHYLHTALSK